MHSHISNPPWTYAIPLAAALMVVAGMLGLFDASAGLALVIAALLLGGAVFAAVRFWPQVMAVGTGGSAGFGIQGLSWYQYLFTQFRALLVYPALVLYPPILTADWDFPISRTLFDRGSIFGLLTALMVALLRAWSTRSFPTPASLERTLGLPVLASVKGR